MKTHLEMLPNGNCEQVIDAFQHECIGNSIFSCVEYGSDIGKLILKVYYGDPYEDGYETEIEVKFCPFCGYKPEINKKKTD